MITLDHKSIINHYHIPSRDGVRSHYEQVDDRADFAALGVGNDVDVRRKQRDCTLAYTLDETGESGCKLLDYFLDGHGRLDFLD